MKTILFLLIFIVAGIPVVSQVNLSNGLVSWLPFNGNGLDASGNNNNGLPQNGVQLTTDRFGNANSAYLLDGIDDHFIVKDPLKQLSTTPFSMVIWFQTTSANPQALVGKRDFGPTNGQQFNTVILSGGNTMDAAVISNAIPCSADLTPPVISRSVYIGPVCFEKWHCVIVSFDGALQKMYLDGQLVSQHVPAFNTLLQCSSDLRLGNWWSGDPLWFKGKLDDFRWYNRVLNTDEVAALSAGSATTGSLDFVFSTDLCNSTAIEFRNISTSNNNTQWRLGDGNLVSGNTVKHTYAINSPYNVTMISGTNPACIDSVRKTIDLSMKHADVILTSVDTSVCPGDSLLLRTIRPLDFCWANNPFLMQTGQPDVYVKPLSASTFKMYTAAPDVNLVVNGAFSSGNNDFQSDLLFTTSRTGDGQYGIVNRATQWNPLISCTACVDHTDGTGSMQVIDGALSPIAAVWRQQIPVVSGKTYRISFWAQVYQVGDIALPSLYLDENKAGELSFSGGELSQWKKFSVLWNAGNKTSVQVSIRNAVITSPGNWFAIDDIEMIPYQLVYDSVNVKIAGSGLISVTGDTSLCKGGKAQLRATGGANYVWSPAAGLSDPTIANPIASPLNNTMYYVSADVTGSCKTKDSVLISILPSPSIATSPDISLCIGGTGTISATGASKYLWRPAVGFLDPTLASQVVSPSQTTQYAVEGIGDNGCSDTGFVKVVVTKDASIHIPNAFTPNGDGLNDCFRIPNSEGSARFELAIFNRFGERVFYSTNPLTCWDGKYKGKEQGSGAFAYFLKIKNGCGDIFRKGTIVLVK